MINFLTQTFILKNEKISLSSLSSSKSIYNIHKEVKEKVLNMYYEDTNFSIKVEFLSELKVRQIQI
jgi:hypothetical protein